MLLISNTIHILPDEVRSSPKMLTDYINNNGIDASHITPQLLRLLDGKELCLKRIETGSETVSRIFFPNIKIVHLYGQSETILTATYFQIDRSYEVTPIGKPLNGLKVHILDENGKEVPDGVTGELCIEGDYGVKYLNDPEKTNRTFVKLENGNTLIHTGDNGYKDGSGNLIYVSRKDRMVKINGQRVETMEVERKLNAIDGIAVSAVKAWTDRSKQTYIAGYYQADREITEEEIRSELAKTLPDYMIPRYLVRMDILPKNINGKLDRKSLPEPNIDSYKAEYRAPASEAERILCDGFAAALNCGKTGADDDFIALGGDSIKVMRLLVAVNIPNLTAEMILEGKTPAGIAALLNNTNAERIPHSEALPELCPMTEAQLGVYMECLENPDSLKYNIPAYIRLSEDTDLDRYAEAVCKVAEAHPAFRVTAVIADGVPSMKIRNAGITVDTVEAGSVEEELERFVRPFALENGPLYRFEICRYENGAAFLFDVHHLIFDGTSLEIFVNQIERAYEGAEIVPEELTVFDISAWEKALKTSAHYRKAQEFFRERLDGVSVHSLPYSDRTDGEKLTGSGAVIANSLDLFDTDDVSRFTKSNGITENTLFLGAFAYAVRVFSGTEDVTFMTVNNGRHDSRLAESVGMFVKTLPLHFNISDKEEISSFLVNVQNEFFQTMKYDCISFGELVSAYDVNTDVSFVYQSDMLSAAEMPDVGESVSAVDVMMFRDGTGYRALFRYDRNRYTKDYIESLTETYMRIISGMLSNAKLADIRLTSNKTEKAFREMNKTDFPVEYVPVHNLFEKQAFEHPERLAVSAAGEHLSYGELNALADRAAGALSALGLKHEGIVGIVLPRRKEAVISELAVWKASGAFLPMTASYPDDRIIYCLEDSQAQFVITTEEIKKERSEVFSENRGYQTLTIEDLLKNEVPFEGAESSPEQLAYCIYTSGSTGKPKGVMIEHRNLCNFVDANAKNDETHIIVQSGSVMLGIAALSFDFSLLERWLPLCNGLSVCLATDEEIHDPFALASLIKKEGVDLMAATPTFMMGIADIPEVADALKNIRCYDFGAEAFPGALYDRLKNICSDAVIINGYGPTEATISCIAKVLTGGKHITIGKPAANVRAYLMDKEKRLLPAGAPGELIIAGDGVGRGYINLPEKTAESFFTLEGKRAYRSGDFCMLNADGEIEFFGRLDNQVKLRGLRIELGEIESVIAEQPAIKQALVLIRKLNGQDTLCAYYTASEKLDPDKLREALEKKLAYYMVPSAYVQLDVFPTNANGKTDRKALPDPAPVLSTESDSETPMNALEKELRSMAAEVLGTDAFGLNEKFSRLGLTSISAIRLATQIYTKYGISLKAAELVAEGTLRTLEDALLSFWMKEKSVPAEKTETKKAERSVEKEDILYAPLSFMQQGVYADCLASPDTTLYNIPQCIVIPEGISAEELHEAVRTVVLAHPSFSLRFTSYDGNETVQYFEPDYSPEIPVKKMSEDEFSGYRKSFVRPFSLTEEPLARFEIVEADKLYLLMDVHHLITDGASLDIFFRQLCACLDGTSPEKEEYTYFDYLEDEKIAPETEKFFEEQMACCEEATSLIPDIFEEGLEHSEGIISVKSDLKAVARFAAEHEITPAAVYLAAEYIACSRYTCEDSAAISTISNGRSDLRIYNTAGMFIHTLPLTVKFDSSEETLSFVRRVADNYAATIANENYPFAQITQKYDFRPSVSYTYQVGIRSRYSVRDGELQIEDLALSKAKLPVSVYIVGSTEGDGAIQVNYDEALFSESMMRGFAESIENALQGLMSKETLAEISITNEEQWKILDSYNRPFDLNYDPADSAVSLFRKQAKLHPDKTAAIFKDKEYTFRALDELTDRLAEYLYAEMTNLTGQMVLAEQVVPIITSRSENAFILPLAVLKTGCAYEPLDPDYPPERLSFMVKDAGAKLLLAERGLEDHISEFDGKLMFIDELYGLLASGSSVTVPAKKIPAPKPEDLLIMLYTSGTTGVPKGVQLIHENLVSFTHGSALDGLYTEQSRTATYASFGFDVNMADTFCTMLNGGTIILIPEEARMNLDTLAAYFDEAEVTDVLLTTQVGVQFINNFPKLKTLRMMTVGGEKLPAINVDQLSYTVYNGYGPTENCAGVSIFPVRKWEPNIPIGRPMQTIHAFILDKTGHRLPAGAAGEYCLSGPQVGRGYLNRPDKTAEAFEKCPFNKFRMYHTGDIVRYRENGDVEFVGRKDGQVKVRGFRVELKEIEAVIREYESIDDVTVQAYDYESGGKYLVAFVTGRSNIDVKDAAEFIRQRKPAYMVPAIIQQIDEIPLTVNRKVDRKALPKPELQKSGYTVPETEAEEDFCRIFSEILGVDKIGAEDDFFELGGSSISAIKVVLAAGKAGYEIVYQNVFDYSTPRLLGAFAAEDAEKITKPVAKSGTEENISGSYYGPNTTEIGRDGYDYTQINALLRKNTMDAFRNGELQEVGDVLLTGSTGFLGIHVLHDLIKNGDRKIYCLSRSRNGVSGEQRLKELLQYYFSNDYQELFGSRLIILEGDATDAGTLDVFSPEERLTVINCAANVAHFAKGDAIWRANVISVENLIDWCIAHDSRLVHISTGSVSGDSENGIPGKDFRLDEHVLFAGQLVENNQYCHSKFMAERLIYSAILEKGLHAKVMRVSNLAPRFTDGMVQINYTTNNILSTLKAYQTLRKASYDMIGVPMEFSPIDYVARAILTLAQTPEDCICFILTNEYMPKMGRVLMQLGCPGHEMKMVEPEELDRSVHDALENPEMTEVMRPLIAYAKSKKEGEVQSYGFDVLDGSHSMQLLYRLGFSWPVADEAYIGRFVSRLYNLGFFEK